MKQFENNDAGVKAGLAIERTKQLVVASIPYRDPQLPFEDTLSWFDEHQVDRESMARTLVPTLYKLMQDMPDD